MNQLIFGLALFFGIHSISIFSPTFRDRAVAKIGVVVWKSIYSFISLLGFILIVEGYGSARMEPSVLYTSPTWLRHVAMLLMVLVFPMILSAYFSGQIKRTLKNPMLVGIKLWAFAHLLVNGNVADMWLFGGFFLWALFQQLAVKPHARRAFTGLPASRANDVIAIALGVLLYAGFVYWAHEALIGMPVIVR